MHLCNVYDNLISRDKLVEIEKYVSQFKYSRFETDTEEYDFKTDTYDFKKNDPFLLETASEYFGYPLLSHFVLGGKVTHNPDKQTNSGGGWHRDNRAKQVKTLVYLSDVSEENGPYLFLPHSDKFDLPTRDGIGKVTRYEDKIIEEFCKENKFEPFRVAGKAGTVIFTDTTFIHRGANINSGTRYTYTNYYFENHPQRIAITENDWGKSFI